MWLIKKKYPLVQKESNNEVEVICKLEILKKYSK